MDVETAKQIFSAGKYLEQDGKIEQAIACYQQATRLDPENYQYHYQLGSILYQQGLIEEAILSFQQAIAVNPNHSWSHHTLGEVYALQADFITAIKYYQQAIELNPEFAWSHYNLGRIFHQQKQYAAARSCYEQAIALDSNFDWSHYFLAELLIASPEAETAVEHYYKAIELNPNFYEAYYQLARYQQNQGKFESAAKYYYQGLKINQQEYNCYYHLGETLIQLKRFTEAISCYESAIALQPNNLQSYFYLGKTLIAQGEKALAAYRRAAQNRSPKFQVNLEIGLAQAWQQLEQFSQSIECCQNAIKTDPTEEIPFKILQYIPTETEAVERIITFYQQIGNSHQTCPLLWGNLGDLLTKQSRIEEAIDCYRTSNYENAILKNPQLIKLDWQKNKQNAPDFIIIGATKCGTTSLFTYLNQNPQVLAPHKKEINFFNDNFNLGVSWYLAHFPAIADLSEFVTGEASPFYIYDQQVITRVKQLFPDVKLIAMLRNPIDRTISEYYHAVNRGLEKRTLDELIDLEKKRLIISSRNKALEKFGYLLNSIYVEKIAQWMNEFPAENILIIKSESFFVDTATVMQEVCQFLGISAPTLEEHIAHNVGTYPPVSADIRQKLQDFFLPYNQELEQYLGRKFNW
jgi:tetratricopeptide (TPR) repeat protein